MLDAESPFYIRPRLDTDLMKWGWRFNRSSTLEHVKASGPVLRDLLMKSRELLAEVEKEEQINFGFTQKGLFMFCNTDKGLQKEIEIAGKAKELGIPAEVYSRDEVQKIEPGLELDIVGATFFPKDAHLHPGSLMDGLKTHLDKEGVEFVLNTEITRFESSSNRISKLITSGGDDFDAEQVVMCNGIWSYKLGKTIGKNLIMQGGKGYSITLQNPPVLPQFCGILSEKKVTVTPMFNTLRFAGTMEIAGSDLSINPKKVNGLKKSVCEYLPQFKMEDLAGKEIWSGLRPIAPDGMPYVGKIEGYDNLYASTGHAMMGMSLAPASGLLISELISSGSSELYHPMISPDRFS
jgi:D-amino-acid dehydrogenase